MKKCYLLAVLLYHLHVVSALMCWVCENARSNGECNFRGKLEQCRYNQKACQNTVRTDNQGVWVDKRCKQTTACDSNYIQNPQPAWYPTQCNMEALHTVCRCCCSHDGCNAPLQGCDNVGSVFCNPPKEEILHGQVSCSNGNAVGSVCSFKCDADYGLHGSSTTVCGGNGAWSESTPGCYEIICQIFNERPVNGDVTCDKGSGLGDMCRFHCDDGYRMVGETTTTCIRSVHKDTTFGEWSNPVPKCVAVCEPEQVSPTDGEVQCQGDNVAGSLCTFACDAGFTLNGTNTTRCGSDGRWEDEAPICKRIVCNPPQEANVHVQVSCSDSNEMGSVCSFTCDEEFGLHGSSATVCGEDGVWSDLTPWCFKIGCIDFFWRPINGDVTCDKNIYLGNKCRFHCNDGYRMVGNSTTTCIRSEDRDSVSGVWSNSAPECIAECEPAQRNPSNGEVDCTKDNLAGSACFFACNSAYTLIGNDTTRCGSDGKWDNEAPTCEPKVCDPSPDAPINGFVACTTEGNFRIGTVCEFSCDPNHNVVGAANTTCVETDEGEMIWDNPTPFCELKLCKEQGPLLNGSYTCTDGNMLASVCTFQCTGEDLFLRPSGRDTNFCQNDTEWSEEKPCCAKNCPPHALMDVVFVLDTSSSAGADDWDVMKQFVESVILQFDMGAGTTQVAILPYHNEPGKTSYVLLNETNNSVDLLEKIEAIQYAPGGTSTVTALERVRDIIFQPENGDRPDAVNVVVVITYGRPEGDVLTIANELRSNGALTYALGIESATTDPLDLKLNEIAGDPSRVLHSEESFTGLSEELSEQLAIKICGDPCFDFGEHMERIRSTAVLTSE